MGSYCSTPHKLGKAHLLETSVLQAVANRLRVHSIRSTNAAGSGHPTSCSSIAEIVAVLFFHVMRYKICNPKDPSNDRLVLSKGHAAPILYAAWAEAGLFPVDDLLQLRKIDSNLEGHPTPRLSFVDVATGSLGQGLSCAAGMAYVGKYFDKTNYRVYCIMGDGESAEGSVWEALAFASHYKLDNLVAIFDINRLGQSDPTPLQHDLDAYKSRLEAFGWHAHVVDGHNISELCKKLEDAKHVKEKPTAILAKTYKGKRFPDWSMADCEASEDCIGIRMKCIDKKCMCDFQEYVLLEDHWLGTGCYAKAQLFDNCVTSEQCLAVNRNSYCNRSNRCTCSHGFFFDGRDCIIRYDNNLKAQEVYKAAVVAAACFIVAIVGIFVACIVRRSFCRREGHGHHTSPANNDVFSVSDEIAALRAVDKPPSYEEVLQIERTFFGIPPPEYSSVRGSHYRPNQNVVSSISSYFANDAENHYLQQSGTSAVTSPTSELSTTTVLDSPSNDSNHSTITTALISSFSETSCVNTIDTDSTALPASSEESILRNSSNNPLLSEADLVNSQLASFFPVILTPLTRHVSLTHHSPLTSRFARPHLPPSSASLPSSPQLMHNLSHNSTFMPSTDLLSLQQTTPHAPENSQAVPSDEYNISCISNSPSPVEDLSLEESLNNDSRRDSLILCCEEAPSLTSYVNSAFVNDEQQHE